MASRGRVTGSEFANKHKLKSSAVNPRANRLHRRSLDWMQSRQEEVDRRRKIDELSPLQEGESTLKENETVTKDDTPVKPKEESGLCPNFEFTLTTYLKKFVIHMIHVTLD